MVQFKRPEPDKPNFRDQLATIDEHGKRKWVYAKKPKGKLTNYRSIVAAILIAFLFIGPFLKINGKELLLLNFLERKIVVFGMQFWPQDFHLFFLAMISLFIFVILFTVTYGRIWCGWACPQTIFMEFIFRKVEYLIEGNARDQKILNEGPWTTNKIIRKTLKHGVFYGISFLISNMFLAYIIGIEELQKLVTDNPFNHLSSLAAMLIFSGIFYFIFAHFREQVCTVVCPYGRLQGVLLDRNSIVVAYDYERGEPKGTFFKGEDRKKAKKGDCINCTQCVQVCPTGIDIRNGTQLECINCTACIDVCNSMMDAVSQKRGLIRYASETMIAEKKTWKFTIRSGFYTAVLIVFLGLIGFSFANRSSVETILLRAPGMLYQEHPDGKVSNLYNIKFINKTDDEMPVEIILTSHKAELQFVSEKISIAPQTMDEAVFFIFFEKKNITGKQMDLQLEIRSEGELIELIETTFVAPN